MKTITIILALALLIPMSSCKKYEDNPLVVLGSKKERVANTWKIEKAYKDGEDITDNYEQYSIYFSKNGDSKIVANYSYGDFSAEFETDGTWMFKDNKETIEVDYENDDADNEYQILRLTEKELWLREKGNEIELHLIPSQS